MIKAGIIDDDSLVCGELIRLLIGHPDVKLMCVASQLHAPLPVASVHRSLAGETSLAYVESPLLDDLDVLFVCAADGFTRNWLDTTAVPQHLHIIDLSPDYRLPAEGNAFVYGLPEVNRKYMVHGCTRVACPGNVAMAVMLALLPLARNLMLVSDLNVTVLQGGDGVACVNSVDRHGQHDEILHAISAMQTSFKHNINILTIDAAVSSGILAVVSTESNVDLDVLHMLYDEYYADHNFTFRVDYQPDVVDVMGTGKCYLHLERSGRRLVVTAAIDGLLKGAASIAAHSKTLMFGLEECTGLKVKHTPPPDRTRHQ